MSLVAQEPGTAPYCYERVNVLLGAEGIERFRAVVAYARWDGIGLIATNIESLLKGGSELQTIYGIANGITTPDSLLYSLYLQEIYKSHTYAGGVEDKYANSTFHPKFFEFRYSDRTVALIGSANLTGAGMSRNTEMVAEVEVARGSSLEKEMELAWESARSTSREVTAALIRSSKRDGALGSERRETETVARKSKLPRLKTGAKASPKPLFSKILDLGKPFKKSRVLAKCDTLTELPKKLYLQILEYETGAGSSGGVGYQIQLPVATLGSFFGVGAEEKKEVTFRFGAESFTVGLTHFKNKTHRVRLKPVRDAPRPTIVAFERIEGDAYECAIVPSKDYSKVLISKCKQQTRKGARKWGLE